MTENDKIKAARKLCVIRGLDPEEMVMYTPRRKSGSTCDVMEYVPRWVNAKGEIEEYLQIQEAVNCVLFEF